MEVPPRGQVGRVSSPPPDRLWVVRHGESAGNVARDRAEADRQDRIDLAHRDVDVPLSDRGVDQARALGSFVQGLEQPPTAVWTSPYVRALDTARAALDAARLDVPVVVDERLREREFGVLDGLTRQGITSLFPEESERRRRIGKFYHRPPGGESWSDVLLRLRGALSDLQAQESGGRVLLVAHQVVVLLVRYVLEGMTEQEVLEVDRGGEVLNCSVTTYEARGRSLALVSYNEVEHLDRAEADVTSDSDAPRAPR